MLSLLGDEPGVGQLLPVRTVEGGLHRHLNLTLEDATPDGVRAWSVGHGQSGGLALGCGDRHFQDVWDYADPGALHLVGDGAQLHAGEVVTAHQ